MASSSSTPLPFFKALQRGLLASATSYTQVEPELYMVRSSRGTFFLRASSWDMEDAASRYSLKETAR